MALFWINDRGDFEIHNSEFFQIISLVQTSMIFAIQNPWGKILLNKCVIKDTLSEQSLFQLTYANMEIRNSTINTNYAKLGAHVFSSIQSKINISETMFNNSLNNFKVPKDIILS